MGDKTKEPRKVWDNPQAQAVLRDAVRESDTAKRQALFDQLHTMMIHDTPMVIIYNGTVAAALRDSVKGFHSWPVSSPRLWGVSLAAQ
jgi:peptide/nickel transport system substrate-binding protein